MPLLNKKRIVLSSPIRLDGKRRRKEVYYLKCTDEVFPNYESYIKRWTLCHRRIWECEVTGRQHLTYQQAKESEQGDIRVEFKFCLVLRKRLLSHIQFKTMGLDALAQNLYTTFLTDFVIGEVVYCSLGGHTYLGQILDIIPNPNFIPPPPSIKNEEEDEEEECVPRQANGRLRFPDAFLHPEPTSVDSTTNNNRITSSTQSKHSLDSNRFRYRVQLIDNEGAPLEKSVRILELSELSRDSHYFNHSVLQHLIRETASRDSYIGAPWLLKEHVAKQYDISTKLPSQLQKVQDTAYYNIIQQRQQQRPRRTLSNNYPQHSPNHHSNSSTSTWSIHQSFPPSNHLAMKEERDAEKQARKEEHQRLKIQQKLEKERIREERKKQAAVKYPIEDLDLPIYRKDPNHHWTLVDMTPSNYHLPPSQQQQVSTSSPSSLLNSPVTTPIIDNTNQHQSSFNQEKSSSVRIPYPCGGRGPRPIPNERSCLDTMDDQQFEAMMTVWSFLTVFSVPLKLPTMTIELFESSLLTPTTSGSTTTSTSLTPLIQSFTSLLNIIIKERQQGTTSDIVNGDHVEDYLQDNADSSSSAEDDSDDDDDDKDKKEDDTPRMDSDNDDDDDNERSIRKRATIERRKTRQSTGSLKRNDTREKYNGDNKNNSDDKDDDDSHSGLGWREQEPLRLSKDWDKKEIRSDRRNWLVALIGCLNDVATPLLVPGIDSILHHLLPRAHSTIVERDRQFASLDIGRKLQLLSFLIEVVNESVIIKNYMDECQDQMTELRRQKAEWNKEYKLFVARKAALEKKQDEQLQKRQGNDDTTDGQDADNDTNDSTADADEHNKTLDEDDDDDEDNDNDEFSDDDEDMDEDDDDDDDEDLDEEDEDEDESEASSDDENGFSGSDVENQSERIPKKRKTKYGQLHQSRQVKLQRKKQRRAIKEELQKKRHAKKKQEAKLKHQELRQRQEDRRQLKQEEQALKQKEEQLEREMRRYMILRIRPLGKDRFFNRYLYLDNIGTPDHHGTGRLYVQSPTFVDILQMMDRDFHPSSNGVVSGPTTIGSPASSSAAATPTPNGQQYQDESTSITPAWGRGGGRQFILELMKEQGLIKERDWLAQRMDALQQELDNVDTIRQQSSSSTLDHSFCSHHPALSQHLHQQQGGGWWYYYSDPEQIHQLLAWLNPKGIREYKLRNEIVKHQHYIMESMKKHDKMEKQSTQTTQATPTSPITRVTRAKKS
ncbi:uncharacterized protein BX664DRAFT_335154 [Halteromyces radiatus]|uniref:uncharacterized protein n=1 Tax=Halteromyces radiatus TaxID=101107 RepID=UPI0022205C30|nr:uncharacterized protein BX664DRAFT_335154 [Halteromyces radiatus]KAI8086198.1 hypothetical protein BX664DRAFT_335154 [Halteromyces radiatus]